MRPADAPSSSQTKGPFGLLPQDLLRPILQQAILGCDDPHERQRTILALKQVRRSWSVEMEDLDELVVTSYAQAVALLEHIRREGGTPPRTRTLWMHFVRDSIMEEIPAIANTLDQLYQGLPELRSLHLMGSVKPDPRRHRPTTPFLPTSHGNNLHHLQVDIVGKKVFVTMTLWRLLLQSPNIKHLELITTSPFKWSTEDVTSIKMPKMPCLRTLRLDGPSASATVLANFLKPFPSLYELAVPILTGDPETFWDAIAALTSLRSLALHTNASALQATLDHTSTLPCLHTLILTIFPTPVDPFDLSGLLSTLPGLSAVTARLPMLLMDTLVSAFESPGAFGALRIVRITLSMDWEESEGEKLALGLSEMDLDELRLRFGVAVDLRSES